MSSGISMYWMLAPSSAKVTEWIWISPIARTHRLVIEEAAQTDRAGRAQVHALVFGGGEDGLGEDECHPPVRLVALRPGPAGPAPVTSDVTKQLLNHCCL